MDLIQRIPKVDKILAEPACQRLLADHPRPVVLAAIRQTLEKLRTAAKSDALTAADLEPAMIYAGVERTLTAGEDVTLIEEGMPVRQGQFLDNGCTKDLLVQRTAQCARCLARF